MGFRQFRQAVNNFINFFPVTHSNTKTSKRLSSWKRCRLPRVQEAPLTLHGELYSIPRKQAFCLFLDSNVPTNLAAWQKLLEISWPQIRRSADFTQFRNIGWLVSNLWNGNFFRWVHGSQNRLTDIPLNASLDISWQESSCCSFATNIAVDRVYNPLY